MSKFNSASARPAVMSPVVTERTPTGRTYEGAPGYARDLKSELFLLAVANTVGEATFYERAVYRDERYEQLIREAAIADPTWTASLLRWLRAEGNMRSAALVGAAEAVKARLEANAGGVEGINRKMIASVLQRADEPGELIAYWTSRYGRTIPKPVKRGIGDAVQRLYSGRSLLKYDTAGHGYRFGDVIDLVHPTPAADKPWQGDLFRYALDRRHHREETGPVPPVVAANIALRAEVAAGEYGGLLDAERLNAAGMTWEDALSLAGSKVDKAQLWEAMIPSMGLFALARNLRNFDQAGVSDEAAASVAARFADADEVATSRMFPFRWLAAYRHAPSLRWGHALDRALTASLANVPALPGRTLILVDVSGSMGTPSVGSLSDMTRMDAAAVFGAALALKTDPTLVAFSTSSNRVAVHAGGSLLRLVESIPRWGGGTNTAAAVQRWYAGHDRVVLVTDEQAHYAGFGDIAAAVPAHVPVYTWNLAGYRLGHAPSGVAVRHTFGGLSDAAFRLIPLIEAGRSGDWSTIFGADE